MSISKGNTRQQPRIRAQRPLAAACVAGLLSVGLVGSAWASAVPAGVTGGQAGTPVRLRSAIGGAAGNGGQSGGGSTHSNVSGSVGTAGNGGDGGDGGDAGAFAGAGGAAGLTATVNSTVTNATGGIGGSGSSGGIGNGGQDCTPYASGDGGGGGGSGVYVKPGVSVTNGTGSTIRGGAGGAGGYGYCYYHPGAGGGGGNGVEFAGTGTLVNKGVIQGGSAGVVGGGGDGPSGAGGGHGVIGAGITITNSGVITAGVASAGNNGGSTDGTDGDAILFTGGSNALDLLAGSTITGNIELANATSASIAPQDPGLTLSNNIVLDTSSSSAGFDTTSAPLIVSGVISGAGSLSEAGSNSNPLILSASNTFTGGTYVHSGKLQVDGVIGDVTMSGGFLGGGGYVGNMIASGGSVSPGEAGQTLYSSGNVNLGAASTLSIRSTDGSVCSGVYSYGTVTLAGNLSIHFENAPKLGATCTIFVSLTDISGTFATVMSVPATVTITYDTNEIQLTVTASDGIFADGFNGSAG